MRYLSFVLLPILLVLNPGTRQARAQFGGHFGSAVAIDDNQALVMKPGGAFGGVASIYVFTLSDESWTETQRLYPISSGETGEALFPSMMINQGMLVAAAADPLLQWGAHVFTSDQGQWVAGSRVPADTTVQTEPSASMSLNDFMQYIQPARRVIGFNGKVLAVGIQAGSNPISGIHLFRHTDNHWTRFQTLQIPDGLQGATLSLGDDYLVVGNPKRGTSGEAYVFEENSAGDWIQTSTLQSDHIQNGAELASSIVVQGNKVVLGAPGQPGTSGSVIGFKKDEIEGTWTEWLHIKPSDEPDGTLFGKAVAFVDEEIWIGAPMADEGKGQVFRAIVQDQSFRLSKFEPELRASGWMFGSSIAGHGRFAVIGAPGAFSGDGHAAVYASNENDDWQLDTWLRPEAPLKAITGTENLCEEGQALDFDCKDVDLLSFLPIADFGGAPGERVSDIWGWTDPLNNREFALIGRTGGAAIVDVTNPTLPVYVGLVTANPTNVRDLKVYKNHLFFTGDGAGEHGLVVFDLTRIRAITDTPSLFEPDTIYEGIASAHNLILDQESGFAYPVGASGGGETCGGGLHMVDIRTPLNPTFAGCYEDTIGLFSDGRTHDGQCVAYKGPDSRYSGHQICFASNETGLRIVDVTDKENPLPISVARYPRVAYVHQGWLTDDHRYFYLNDELDELVGMTPNTRTMVWDIAELDDPVLVGAFQGETTATDHNLYIKGNRMYQANYESGLRVWDVSNPEQPREIGHFDTTPNDEANPPGFFGAWTAYPYFESGTIIVSSIGEGLFVVKPREQEMP